MTVAVEDVGRRQTIKKDAINYAISTYITIRIGAEVVEKSFPISRQIPFVSSCGLNGIENSTTY